MNVRNLGAYSTLRFILRDVNAESERCDQMAIELAFTVLS